MNLNEYQERANGFANHDMDQDQALAVWALGLTGEAGETADHIKKYLGHGHDLDIDAVEKELGDVLWYIATLAKQLDLSLESIANRNIAKLTTRYGEKFSVEASKNRVA